MEIVYVLLIGVAAGWIAGQLTKGGGFGLLGNLIVGILGAILGGVLLPLVGLRATETLIGLLVQSTIGALVLLVLLGLAFKKSRKR